jgi:hypothetical protein
MLNGSLDTVALPDVLRLIATSGKSGLLRVTDASPSGRIFIVDGRVAFATNRNDDDPIDDLLHMEYRADYVGSPEDRRIVDLSELLESNPEAFGRFLEQMIVEVLSRLLRVNEGEFRFDVDIRSRREVPYAFGIEEMIAQAQARADAWNRVFEVVPSVDDSFRMAPRLDQDEEIVLARRDWAILAVTGASSTVNRIARELKIFEFAAAKKVAELVQRGLIEFVSTEVPASSVTASGLLSDVAETHEIHLDEPSELLEGSTEPTPPIEFEQPESDVEPEPVDDQSAAGEDLANDSGPTWLAIEEEPGPDIDDDPVPLLEELRRLHEADEADEAISTPAAPVATNEKPASEPPPEEADGVAADSMEEGDLATRWKNLRKAKRGVNATSE